MDQCRIIAAITSVMTNHRLRGAMLNAGMTPGRPGRRGRGRRQERHAVDLRGPAALPGDPREGRPESLNRRRRSSGRHCSMPPKHLPLRRRDRTSLADAKCDLERDLARFVLEATEQLDILVYAGAFLIETLDLADVLEWKVSAGTRFACSSAIPRVLRCGCEQRSCRWTGCRSGVEATLDYLQRVAGIAVRSHQATHYASLFRFDDIVLANVHAFGVWSCHSPVIQLRRVCSGRLFDFYTQSFECVWATNMVVQPSLR